jgi:hypothetical protein
MTKVTMRRLISGTVLMAVAVLVARKIAGEAAPAMRARCAEACDRMLANMPESFPPNRMMADLDEVKDQTARILDEIERQTGPQA